MKFEISNNSVLVSGASAMEDQQIETFCKFWHRGEIIMGKKSRWRKVEPIILYKDQCFPTGLLETFIEMFDGVEVIDQRIIPPTTPFDKNYEFSFLPHQQEAATFLTENVRGIVVAPTGFGKTYVAGEAIWQTQTLPFLYVVGVTSSLLQMREKLGGFLKIQVGIRGAGHRETAPVLISTAASAAKLDLSVFKGVVFDEVHKIPANTYYKIAQGCINAYWCFGITGTITGRSDGLDKMITALLSRNQYVVPFDEADLPPTKTLFIPVIVPYEEGEFVQTFGTCIVHNSERNKVIAHIAQTSFTGKNLVFVYVGRREHGHLLQEMIPDAVYADKDTSLTERQRILESKCILIATSIFAESIDSPQLDTVIFTAGGHSRIIVQQVVGRGLRRVEGKKLMVYDFLDQDGALYEKHSIDRKRYYEGYGPVRFLI